MPRFVFFDCKVEDGGVMFYAVGVLADVGAWCFVFYDVEGEGRHCITQRMGEEVW